MNRRTDRFSDKENLKAIFPVPQETVLHEITSNVFGRNSPTKTKTKTMKHLYHYTRANNLIGILNSGQIEQATIGVDTAREKPVVWLSSNPVWEPTATPMQSDLSDLTFEEFAEIETPIRIQVDPAKYRLGWLAFTRLSGGKPRVAKYLKRSAEQAGANVSQWRISFHPIPSDDWIRIEGFVDGVWKIITQPMLAVIAEVRVPVPASSISPIMS